MNMRALVMTFIGLVGCGIGLKRPYISLLMLIVLYFFRPDLWGAEQYVRPVLWLTVATLAGYFLTRGQERWPSSVLPYLAVLTGLYALANFAGPLATSDSWLALYEIVKIFVVVYLIGQLCGTPRRLAGVLAAILVGNLWFVKVTLMTWVSSGLSATMRVDTAVGQGGGANYIAWVLATTAPLLAYKLARGRGWERLAAAAMLPGWLLAVVVTGSRGGLLCLAAGILTLLVLTRQFRLAVVALLLGGLLVWLAPQERMERAETITLDPSKMDASMLSRYQNVQIGLKLIRDRPLIGTGLDTFPKAKQKYLPRNYAGIKEHVAHNTYIQMGVEIGPMMLAAFVLLNIAAIRRLGRRPDGLEEQDMRGMEWIRVGVIVAIVTTWLQMAKGDMAKSDYFWWLYGAAFAYGAIQERAAKRLTQIVRENALPERARPTWLPVGAGRSG